jgi:hypothetical protein
LEYLNEFAEYPTRKDYLLHYNELDTQIMVPIIDTLIDNFAAYYVDMLKNISLSACSSQVKYAIPYRDFDINADYSLQTKTTFKLSKKYWAYKVKGYNQQDKAAKRGIENNVSEDDYQYFKQLLEHSKCHLCDEGFTYDNKPTLDRINNKLGHSIDNVLPCCLYCNCYKADHDEDTIKLFIKLRKFAVLRNLPFTLSRNDAALYRLIRDGITGGLSNVHNRLNLKGKTTIKKLKWVKRSAEESETNGGCGVVEIYDTHNVMTHCIGLDFNSLYPSSFASMYHEFNPYTNHIMYMPGSVEKHITDKDEAMRVIEGRNTLFIANIKGEIPKEYYDSVINFPPIFRNITIKTSEDVIGSTMYNYMKDNKLSVDKEERKLTQLLNTNGEFMAFSSYYLWFLIDT